jgi:hypothetical protein
MLDILGAGFNISSGLKLSPKQAITIVLVNV